MRTTIELTEAQHQALTSLAARRNLRGFSTLVQEAVDGYLQAHSADALAAALALEGTLTDEEADDMRASIDAAWSGPWRSPA